MKISKATRDALQSLPTAKYDINAVYQFVNQQHLDAFGYEANMSSVVRTWNREREKLSNLIPVKQKPCDYSVVDSK